MFYNIQKTNVHGLSLSLSLSLSFFLSLLSILYLVLNTSSEFFLLLLLLKYISVGIAERTASTWSAVWVISVAVIHHRFSQVHT